MTDHLHDFLARRALKRAWTLDAIARRERKRSIQFTHGAADRILVECAGAGSGIEVKYRALDAAFLREELRIYAA